MGVAVFTYCSAGTDCRSDGAVRYYDNCVCRVVSVCQCMCCGVFNVSLTVQVDMYDILHS